jgi:ABC-type amino acid transport substrate-binding protein
MGGRCGMSITAMFALMSIAADAEADVRFGIASEPYPPFAWKDASGEWVGWEVDLMNAVCGVQSGTVHVRFAEQYYGAR